MRRIKAPCNLKANRIKADRILQAWLASIPGVVMDLRAGFSASPENKWPIDCPRFTLSTELGLLDVLPASSHGNYPGYTCFACFAEPKRAAAVIGRSNMNDYSGKWNHYSFAEDGLTPEQFAALISVEIRDYFRPDLTPLPFPDDFVIVNKRMVRVQS